MAQEKQRKIKVFWFITGIACLIGFLVFGPIGSNILMAWFGTSQPVPTQTQSMIDAFGKDSSGNPNISLASQTIPTSSPTSTPKPNSTPTPTQTSSPLPPGIDAPLPKPKQPYQQPIYTQDVVRLRPELWPVCSCETSYIGTKYGQARQFENGQVIRGYTSPEDIGMCQISLTWHGSEAEQLGYDLFKEEENIKFANYLFSVQGYLPWFRSKFCWNKP